MNNNRNGRGLLLAAPRQQLRLVAPVVDSKHTARRRLPGQRARVLQAGRQDKMVVRHDAAVLEAQAALVAVDPDDLALHKVDPAVSHATPTHQCSHPTCAPSRGVYARDAAMPAAAVGAPWSDTMHRLLKRRCGL